jgi:hypothetical protein
VSVEAPRSVGWSRRLAAAAVLVAVVWPAVRGRDSFPLSTYPMYAQTRGDVVSIATVVGVDDRGATHRLTLRDIANTDDPLVAESAVQRAIRSGQADQLCAEVATRVRDDLLRLEVVAEQHDVVAHAEGDDSRQTRTVHASCEVQR